MCFQVQIFIPCGPCRIFDELHEVFAVALAFGGIVQVKFLQFSAISDAVKFGKACAADDLPIFAKGDKLRALGGLAVIKAAQMVQFRVEIDRARQIEMKFFQIETDDFGDFCIIGRGYFSVL